MTIIKRLEREAKRHPGGAVEGIRIALRVLSECTCDRCLHHTWHVETSDPASDGEEYLDCDHPQGLTGIVASDSCCHWENNR